MELRGPRASAKQQRPTKVLPKGKVLLHQFERGPFAPNMSPFPLKLETYLRFNKIPYEIDTKQPMSYKGKCPWIELNGEAVADSQFCIERLNQEFGINMDKHLTKEEKAVSLLFRKFAEEHLYFLCGCSRWLRTADEVAKHWSGVPKFVSKYLIPWSVRRATWAQGIGRHSDAERWSIFVNDVTAISDYLGNKPYLMGSEMTEVDCSVFGILVQFTYQDFEKIHDEYIQTHCPNVKKYLERIKHEVWPDWPVQNKKG